MSERNAKPILCVGITPCLQRTLRFDRIEFGEVNRVRSVTVSSGGKAINVARALKTLGGVPLVTGFAGGETGAAMNDYLRRFDIGTDFVATRAATRICTTLIDETTGDTTELVEEAEQPSKEEWHVLDRALAKLLPQCQLVVIAGAPPPNSLIDVYARMVRLAHAADVNVVLDCRGPYLLQALAAAPFFVKLNGRELRATCDRAIESDAQLQRAAQMLTEQGARWVLITRGALPALLHSGDHNWMLNPPSVDVLNAIGSGDAATAGIAAGLSRGYLVPKAVRYGIACGSASALTLEPGDLDPAIVHQLESRVTAKKIDT